MAACSIHDSQKNIDKTNCAKDEPKEYRINYSYTISELKMNLIELVYTKSVFKQMRIDRQIHKA